MPVLLWAENDPIHDARMPKFRKPERLIPKMTKLEDKSCNQADLSRKLCF